MKCKILSCNLERTPFKGSYMCDKHTCHNWQCKKEKSFTAKEYCDDCRCIVKDCDFQKSYNSVACYKHKCSRCFKNFFSENAEKKCKDCILLCNVFLCKNNKKYGSQYCQLHTCEMDNCFNRRYLDNSLNGEYYCRELHGCNKCHQYKHDSLDPQYCQKCLHTCFYGKCDVKKPPDHKERFYYCDKHGCIQCNSLYKHKFTFLREKKSSEYCKNHYLCDVNDCKWYKINDSKFCKKHS